MSEISRAPATAPERRRAPRPTITHTPSSVGALIAFGVMLALLGTALAAKQIGANSNPAFAGAVVAFVVAAICGVVHDRRMKAGS
ncbi:hypothetical protein ACQSSU_20845 [Micromonospora echinospora]